MKEWYAWYGEDISVLHFDDDPELTTSSAALPTNATPSPFSPPKAAEGSTIAGHTFDCVVSDYDMPERDGLDFLEALREDAPDLPFILFTGEGSEEVASDAISAGVTDYLQKEQGTGQYTVLANRIEHAVEERRAKTALEESERMLSTLISNLPGMVYRARNEPIGRWSSLATVQRS